MTDQTQRLYGAAVPGRALPLDWRRVGAGCGYPNKTYSGICPTGSSGKVRVEILSNGKPVKSTKFAYQIFDKEPGIAVFAAEDGTDNDYNDAIVILNWPLG